MSYEAPQLVQRAEELGRELGFEKSCRPETGQLLMTLAATAVDGHILELGTGCGYGAAWLASGLPANGLARITTIDTNEQLIARVQALFIDYQEIHALAGHWHDALERGPFDLVFVDVSEAKTAGVDDVVAALVPGGIALIDDLTPIEMWPEEWQGKPDLVRDAWLGHPDLIAAEIRVAADHAAILAVKHPSP